MTCNRMTESASKNTSANIETIFQLNDVFFAYGKQEVLHGLTCGITRGTFTAIVGPNGCGKSTLMSLLSRNHVPAQGKIIFMNKILNQWPRKEYARQVSYLPQANEIAFDFTVREVVAMGRFPYTGRFGTMTAKDWQATEEAIHTHELHGMADKPVTQLSGGERQRVALARIQAAETDVWLLDEPTANLDVHHALELLQSLRKLAESGKTVVTVLHELNLAALYAKHAIMMQSGQIVAHGQTEDVFTEKRIEDVFQVGCRIQQAQKNKGMEISLFPQSAQATPASSIIN